MYQNGTSKWTPERVDRLEALCKSGYSAGQIAQIFGDVSRNAVIGKVHRLKLVLMSSGSGLRVKGDFVARLRASQRLQNGVKRRAPKKRAAAYMRREPVMKSEPLPPDPPVSGAPAPLLLKFADLTAASCRWPVGDPQHADFGFCGHARKDGLPYCEDHARRAYSPAVSRVAVKRAA